ncbi:MAG: hypothetical protein SFV15_21345 [Polyangiaceae bacterium]|nr:hypothetical protein [Polyangiaceae bacterium]
MHQERPALALGSFTPEDEARLVEAAQASAFVLHTSHTAGDATRWLSEHQPHAMLVDTASIQPESIAMRARAEARHAQVPVLALSREITDLDFATAFAWGADDLVLTTDATALVGRMRRLPREAPAAPVASRGVALVAETDPVRRLLLGRVLRNAGYEITFAVTREDMCAFSTAKELQVIVTNSELCGDAAQFVADLRAAGSVAECVIHTAPRHLKELHQAVDELEGVAAADGFAPPENILFISNELKNGHRFNQRGSARILYGTTVAFRGAGRHNDDFGYSYNISDGGLYVRTLFPPEDNTVWVELCPPRTERRVRLEGTVAWRRLLGPQQQATVPPGFGVKITDAARADLAAWQEGYETIRQALS